MKIKKKIVLIGMMGSGKSTIGALLSKKMNMKFIDLDQKIETIEKQTISQIFKLKGEKYFRTIEVKTILSLLDSKEKELVLSLHSGRNRIVRRIFEFLTYKVTKLDRISFAGISKKKTQRGKFRHLSKKEIGFLKMK